MEKKYISSIVFFVICIIISVQVRSQNHPFQDTSLSDEERLDNLISLMTLEEKINHLSPFLRGIERLGLKGTRTVEGLHGLAWSGPANWAVKGEFAAPTTTFPQAIGLAHTWDPELVKEIAGWEAEEARYLAQNKNFGNGGLIVFAPNADMGRDIRWGRTEECFGEDPFLAAKLTVAYVKGLQGDNPRYWKTASLMKHFLANSNENNRFINSSDFDERLFYEYYSFAFYKGIVEGGSRAYMAAYNKYNGIPCTVHPVLKRVTVAEWGQDGIICTDGGGFSRLVSDHKYFPDLTVAASACIKAGINMFLDRYRDPLKDAIDKGLVTEDDIDQVLRGTLRVMLKLGLMDENPSNPYTSIGISDTTRPWMKQEAKELVRKATAKSVVLLKNEGLLPLDMNNIRSIAVIGPGANLVVSDWYSGTPPYSVSILEGIQNAVSDDIEIYFAESNKADSAILAAGKADVALVCIGNHPLSYGLGWGQNYVPSDGREEVDRQAISIEQEDLVKLVKKANPKTILVMVSSFPYSIVWSKENIPAILHITQSSQELGNGLADVVFGKVSPAGRLVQTWSASIDDLLPILDYNIRNGRTYMYDNHKPLFSFGHGLSYTTFEYSGLDVGSESIIDGEIVEISITVRNAGSMDSDEIVQLYASFPDSQVERPEISLKGFKRVYIPAGESKEISFQLNADDLRYWDVGRHEYRLEKGEIRLMVGASSSDIRLTGSLLAE